MFAQAKFSHVQGLCRDINGHGWILLREVSGGCPGLGGPARTSQRKELFEAGAVKNKQKTTTVRVVRRRLHLQGRRGSSRNHWPGRKYVGGGNGRRPPVPVNIWYTLGKEVCHFWQKHLIWKVCISPNAGVVADLHNAHHVCRLPVSCFAEG